MVKAVQESRKAVDSVSFLFIPLHVLGDDTDVYVFREVHLLTFNESDDEPLTYRLPSAGLAATSGFWLFFSFGNFKLANSSFLLACMTSS